MSVFGELLTLVMNDKAEELEQYLQTHPEFDVNSLSDVAHYSKHPLLQAAVSNKAIKTLKMLLKQPTIDINRVDANGNTAFSTACIAAGFENDKTAHLLLDDPRVDVNVADGQTTGDGYFMGALWMAVDCGATDLVKYWLASTTVGAVSGKIRHQEMKVDQLLIDLGSTPRSWSADALALLREFQAQPELTVARIRVEMQTNNHEA